MGFIALLSIGVFLVLGIVGFVQIMIAIILALVNRHRKRTGRKKSMPVRVAGIVFLVLGFINCLPILAALAMAAVEEGKSCLEDRRLLATVPERAEFAGAEPIKDPSGEEILSESYVSYKGNEYVCVHLVPVMERLELSEKKAYVESGGHLSENYPLYELKTDTGYDLILVGDLENSGNQDVLYCKREQEDDFVAECRGGIEEYRLYDEDDEDDGFPEEAGRKVSAEEFGITDEFLERFLVGDERIQEDSEEDSEEDFEEDSEEEHYDYYYDLYASEMDGRFLEYCLSIYGPTDGGEWLCHSFYLWGRWQDEMGVDGGKDCYASKKMQEYMEAFVEESYSE